MLPQIPQRDYLAGDYDGVRTRLYAQGIDLFANYQGEVFGNVSGGAVLDSLGQTRQVASYDGLLTFGANLDFGKLFGWSGAKLYFSVLELHGSSLTHESLGDIAGFSNIYDYNTIRLSEVYLEQSFFDNQFRVQVGQMLSHDEFFGNSYEELFINVASVAPKARHDRENAASLFSEFPDQSFMKKTTRAICVAAFLSLAICSQSRAATIQLPLYGFQIDALDAAPDASNPTTVIQTFLPATEGFAPNINVQIQPYTGTIKDYAALSKSQFEQMKWKVISDQESGDNEWNVEYTGTFQGSDLHFYERAVSTNGKVYLITATAKESQWAKLNDTLREHVESFKTK